MEKRITVSQKMKWLKDLRSGDFKQGVGALCKHDGLGGHAFCCLGVLGLQFSEIDMGRSFLMVGEQWVIVPEAQQKALAGMNDAGIPFVEIAKYVDVHVDARDDEVED